MLPLFILRAAVSMALLSMIAGTAGLYTEMRGLSFLIAAVAHAALGGAALGVFLMVRGVPIPPEAFALAFSLMVAVLAGVAGGRALETVRMETAVGVAFALSMCVASLFLYYIPPAMQPLIWSYLVGDPLLVTDVELLMLSAAASLTVLVFTFFRREFMYVCFDPEGAAAHGLRTRLYNTAMLVLAAASISLACKVVGAILMYVVTIMPAAASSRLSKSVGSMTLLTGFMALTCQLLGLAVSAAANVPATAVAGLLCAVLYAFSLRAGRPS